MKLSLASRQRETELNNWGMINFSRNKLCHAAKPSRGTNQQSFFNAIARFVGRRHVTAITDCEGLENTKRSTRVMHHQRKEHFFPECSLCLGWAHELRIKVRRYILPSNSSVVRKIVFFFMICVYSFLSIYRSFIFHSRFRRFKTVRWIIFNLSTSFCWPLAEFLSILRHLDTFRSSMIIYRSNILTV